MKADQFAVYIPTFLLLLVCLSNGGKKANAHLGFPG
jgi:hypothetical protein